MKNPQVRWNKYWNILTIAMEWSVKKVEMYCLKLYMQLKNNTLILLNWINNN